MPVPIKPVRDIEDNMPSVLKDGGFSAMGLSELQIKLLGLADLEKEAYSKKSLIDTREADLLQEIWKSQPEEKLCSVKDIKELKISIPNDISENDVIKIKTNGLVVGAGREVSLTLKGERLLKDKILSQPSMYFINRKKEKHDFEKKSSKKHNIRILKYGSVNNE